MNGEVIVVRSDLVQVFDKSQTARVNQAIQKVEQMALKEPQIEHQMQDYLQQTKERGNLSFSQADCSSSIVVELNESTSVATQ